MSTVVGALAVELGLNTAEFEKALKNLGTTSTRSFNQFSADANRATREGAESLRLFDEALGIHISRPIAKILANEFPSLAKGLQSMLGAGVALGVGLAAFEFLEKAIDGIIKKMEEAKKAQLEYEAAVRSLNNTLEEASAAHAKRMAEYQAEIDQLTGDKAGALANRIKVANIEDAEQSISLINRIAEGMEKEAAAAENAATASHRFWLAVGRENTSEHNLTVEDNTKKLLDFRAQLAEAQRTDAMKGTHTGLDMAIAKAKEFDAELANAQKNRVSDFTAFFDDVKKAFTGPNFEGDRGAHSGFTDKELRQLQGQSAEGHAILQNLQDQTAEHNKHLEVLKKQSEAERDIGEKQLTKLRSETEADLALAAATSKTTAEQKLAAAAGQADQIIAGIQEAAHGRLTKAVQEELLAVHALTAERQVAKDTVATNDSLEKSLETTRQEGEAADEMAAAYAKGGAALEAAQIDAKLKAQIQEVQRLHEEYNLTKKAADDYAAAVASLGKQAGPKPGLDISPGHLAQLKAGLDEADAKLGELRTAQAATDQKKYNEELSKTSEQIAAEQPYLDALNKAYGENEQAVRQAEVALQLYHWEQAHPGATAEQIQRENDLLHQQSIEAQRAADAKAAGQYSISTLYQDEIDKLMRIREIMQQNGDDTLVIDAKIHDAQDALIHQWDEAAMKVGDFHTKMTAVMNELVIEGDEAGKSIAGSFLNAIHSGEDELAKFMTGQKVQPQKIVQSLAEQVTKSEIEKGVGAIAAHYNFGGVSLQGKPDGTAGNPLHVVIAGGNSQAAANAAGAAVKAQNQSMPSGAIQEKPSTPGQFFGSLFGAFLGAGFAGGGRVSGPGTSTSDSIPAWLSHGEYVVKASTVDKVGVPFLDSLDTAHFAAGGPTSKDFTYNPNSRDQFTQAYLAYERSLHQGPGNQALFQSLGMLGAKFLLPKLFSVFQHAPTPASTQTPVGGPGYRAGMPFGAGIGSDVDANAAPPGFLTAPSVFPTAASLIPGFADGGSVFADNDFFSAAPTGNAAPASSVTNSTTGGDTYHGDVINGNVINQTIKPQTPSDLMGYTSRQMMERTARRGR